MMTMMPSMTYDEIATFCEASEPLIVYLSIGCAGSPEQQHPPFLKAISEGCEQICILMDPLLEDPLTFTVVDKFTYIPLRRHFRHGHNEEAIFLNRLCFTAMMSRNTRLIVQDYSGFDLRSIYPLSIFGPELRQKVLFDFTYADGGCFVDFSTVRLLVREGGSFVQPHYEPLAAIAPYTTAAQLQFQIRERHECMTLYVKRLYRIQRDQEPERDWCTAAIVAPKIARLCGLYGLPATTETDVLEKLLLAYLLDICALGGTPMPKEEGLALIKRPERDYESILLALKELTSA